MRELVNANRDGTGVLMVTHSAKVAAQSERIIYLVDGGIRGEVSLGKINDESEIPSREKVLNSWLAEQGW